MPSSEELYWFHQCSRVPVPWLDKTHDLIRQHAIQVGNKVKILCGAHRGAIANVMSIFDDKTIQLEVSTSLLAPKVSLNMLISEVRKHVSIGDKIIITAGPHARTKGWVVAVGGSDVEIFDLKECQQVCYFCKMTPIQKLTTLSGNGSLTLYRIPEHRSDLGECTYNSTTRVIC